MKGQLETEEREGMMIEKRFLKWAERMGSTMEGKADYTLEE